MKILHLTLTKKWFDRVGVDKWEEYRYFGAWIKSRLMDRDLNRKHYDAVQFRNGYHRDAPKKTFEYLGFEYGIGNKEWGASGLRQIIIKLGERLKP